MERNICRTFDFMRLLINGYYCDIANKKKSEIPILKSTNISAQSINVWFLFRNFLQLFFSLYHIFKSKKNRNRHGMRYFFLNRCQFDSFLFRSFIHVMVWKIKWNKKEFNTFSKKENWIRYIAMSMDVKKLGVFEIHTIQSYASSGWQTNEMK